MTRNRFMSLWFALPVLILLVALPGCRIAISTDDQSIVTPSGVQTSTTQPTTTQANAAPTAAPVTKSASPTPAVTATPTPAPTKSAATPTPAPTSQTTQAGTTDDLRWLLQYDNSKTGWFFQPANPLGEDRPATLPKSVLTTIEPFKVFWQVQQTEDKILYLTFDEGYEYKDLTSTLLDVLQENNVTASFFITGSYIRHNPAKVRRMAEEGHQILNHTDNHPNLVDLLDQKGPEAVLGELQRVEQAYADLTGRRMPPIMRPPEGSYSERMLALLDRAGYTTAFWSFAYRDWLTDEQPDPAQALKKILDNLHPGSVILLHAVSETNVSILPDLIDTARARGYSFATLPE